MSEGLAVAIISAIVVAGGAGLTFIGTQLLSLHRRIVKLEKRDRLSWIYIRKLIDHGYKNAPTVPLPEPPEGWLEDTE